MSGFSHFVLLLAASAACTRTAALPAEPASERPASSAASSAASAAPLSSSSTSPDASSFALPVCGSADWDAMGRARVSACAARRTDFEAEACVELAKAWHCPADIRVAFDQRWGAGAFVVMQSKQGQWYGIVFARRSGNWTVIGFDGGDIP